MEKRERFSWNFWSAVVFVFYAFISILRWPILPQHIDIYYHLLIAKGFIKAGGYTNWDFLQYAPIGRPHIYPPVFQVILALLMKAGLDGIFLARLFSVIIPVLFLFVFWDLIRRNYSSSLGFWILIAAGSSFSFYNSLTNYLPSTIAMVFGMLSLGQLLNKKILRSVLLFAVCFYTHIGTSWLFVFVFLLYGLFNKDYRKSTLIIVISTVMISLPILAQQLMRLGQISFSVTNEKYFLEFKPIEYILAALGLLLLFKQGREYRLFLAFLLASFIYIIYPSRLFSSEGYLPVIALSAVCLDSVFKNIKDRPYLKGLLVFLIFFFLVLTPTFVTSRNEFNKPEHKIYFFDSPSVNNLFSGHNERAISKTLWFPHFYIPASEAMKKNSELTDIIYCSNDIAGVCLAGICGRGTANCLLPEVSSTIARDRIADSKIIAVLKDQAKAWEHRIAGYGLVKVYESDMFDVYKNPLARANVRIKKAAVPFVVILPIFMLWVLLLWKSGHSRFFG